MLPPGELTLSAAQKALEQFEVDVKQAKALSRGGACETVITDGGSTLEDIITMVKLDEAKNPNKTYRYAERNAYIKTLFTDMNECGLNFIWISKARPLWIGDKRIANEYIPDCHDDIPYMVDVNLQMRAEPAPGAGLNYYGVIGMNAFNPAPVGVSIPNLTWDSLFNLLLAGNGEQQEAPAAS